MKLCGQFCTPGAFDRAQWSSDAEVKCRIQIDRDIMFKLNKIWKNGSVTKNAKIKLVNILIF